MKKAEMHDDPDEGNDELSDENLRVIAGQLADALAILHQEHNLCSLFNRGKLNSLTALQLSQACGHLD